MAGGLYIAIHPERASFWMSQCAFAILFCYVAVFRWPEDSLNPVLPLMLIYFVMFYLRGLFLYFGFDAENVNPAVLENLDLLDRAMLYLAAGIASYVLAFFSPVPRALAAQFKVRPSSLSPAQLAKKAMILFLIGLPFSTARSWFPGLFIGLKTLSMIVLLVSLVSLIGFYLYSLVYFSEQPRRITNTKLLVAMFSVLFVNALVTGYREPIVYVIFTLVAARHYAGKRLSFPQVLAAVSFVGLVVSPLGTAYRRIAWMEGGSGLLSTFRKLPEGIAMGVYMYTGRDVSSLGFASAYIEASFFELIRRFHGLDSLIAVMARVPSQIEYTFGSTLFFIPISALVPRIMWPNKPDTGLGDYFRENFWFGTGGAIAISHPGEFYLNFGLAGIVIGMAFLAFLHSGVYQYFQRAKNPASSVLYVFSLQYFLVLDREVSLTYATLIKFYILLFFVFRFLRSGKQRGIVQPTLLGRRPPLNQLPNN